MTSVLRFFSAPEVVWRRVVTQRLVNGLGSSLAPVCLVAPLDTAMFLGRDGGGGGGVRFTGETGEADIVAITLHSCGFIWELICFYVDVVGGVTNIWCPPTIRVTRPRDCSAVVGPS